MLRAVPLVLFALVTCACTTTPAPTTTVASDSDDEDDGDSAPADTPVVADDAPPAPPRTWAEATERYRSDCPAPPFSLAAPERVSVSGRAFVRSGSAWAFAEPLGAPLVIGVVGAIKDAEPETRENLTVAAAAFRKAGAHVVLVPGDLVANEVSVLPAVAAMLDEVFDLPVLVHSGNYEWTSSLSDTLAEHPGLINMNLAREIDTGAVRLLSLPGYHDRKFLQPGACHYDDDDLAVAKDAAVRAAKDGDVVVLTSHGPPRGDGKGALDRTPDNEHVGDPNLNALLTDGGIRFGIFSHILEAGGRAVTDVDGKTPLKLPMKKGEPRLYMNVGSASSFGWGMNDGTTSRGLGAIVTVDPAAGGTATVAVIKLR